MTGVSEVGYFSLHVVNLDDSNPLDNNCNVTKSQK